LQLYVEATIKSDGIEKIGSIEGIS